MITRSDKIKNRVRDANFFRMMTTGQVPPDAFRGGSKSVFEFIDDQKDFGAYQRDCLFMKRPGLNHYINSSLESPAIDFWDGEPQRLLITTTTELLTYSYQPKVLSIDFSKIRNNLH